MGRFAGSKRAARVRRFWIVRGNPEPLPRGTSRDLTNATHFCATANDRDRKGGAAYPLVVNA